MNIFFKGNVWHDAGAAKVMTTGYVAGDELFVQNQCRLVLTVTTAGTATTSTNIKIQRSQDSGTTWAAYESQNLGTSGAVEVADSVFNLPGANGTYTLRATLNPYERFRIQIKRTGGDGTSTAFIYGNMVTPVPFSLGEFGESASSPASDITILTDGNSGIDNVQDAIKVIHFAGVTEGGELTASGVFYDVAAGSGWIRETDSDTGVLRPVTWDASLGHTLSDNTIDYPGITWNGTTASTVIKTVDTWNYRDEFPLGAIVREGLELHPLVNPQKAVNSGQWVLERFYETHPFQRADRLGGIIISELGTRNVAVTSGELYDRTNEFDIDAINTTSGDTFATYLGTTLVASAASTWDNANFNSDGVLATIPSNEGANLWWYIEADGHLACVYGTDTYTTLGAAEDESAPSTIPLRVEAHGRLIGRFIFQEGASSAILIQSAFTEIFTPSLTTDHGNLAGLADDDHTQYALRDDDVAFNALDVASDVDVDGHAAFGNSGAVASDRTINISEAVTTTSPFYNLYNLLAVNPASPTAASYFGAYDSTVLQGSNSVSGGLDGHRYTAQNYNTGTTSNFRGLSIFAEHWASAGTTTNNYGVQIYSGAVVSGGTITNNYALAIEAISTTGTVTNPWGIYQKGPNDTNYFAGGVGIGTDTPTNRLHVHTTDSGASAIQVTNSTTGSTATDGLEVGIDTNEVARVWNFENTGLEFGTGNASQMLIASDGSVFMYNIPPGSTQVDAGAGTNQIWQNLSGALYIGS